MGDRLARVGVQPPVGLGLDEPEDDRAHAEHGQRDAEQVAARGGLGVTRLGERPDDADDHEQPHRDVDPERPAPGVVGREPAAQQWPEGGHPTDRRPVDGERDHPGAADEERVEARERRRQDHRGTDALHEAGGDQHRPVDGQPGEHRRDHEDDHADEEHQPPALEVADPAHRDEQRREHERVDRVHPLGLGRGEREVLDDHGECDVDDRRVHDDQRDTEADGQQGRPVAAGHQRAGLGDGHGRSVAAGTATRGETVARATPGRGRVTRPRRWCAQAAGRAVTTSARRRATPRTSRPLVRRGGSSTDHTERPPRPESWGPDLRHCRGAA